MYTIDRPGARVAWETSGEGPPVLLGHSLLCDGRMWEDVAPALARRHRVLTIDGRGHRHSTAERAFTLDDLADDWLAIMDAEGIDRAVLCGLSMGGMTAMRVALRAPKRVAGLALLDTSADREPTAARLKYRVMAELTRVFGFPRAFLPTALQAFFGPTTLAGRPALVAQEGDRILERDTRQVYYATRAVFDRPSIADRIGGIGCPTTVIVGEEDAATPPSRAKRIATAIHGATLVTIPRAGHLTAMEAPEAVIAAIGALIDRLPRQHDVWGTTR